MPVSYRRPLLILFAALAAAVNVAAQDAAAKIDELMKLNSAYGQFNGAVLVARSGRVIYKKGFGMANMEWNIPNDSETKFRIGSVTKQFTAAIILQLVEQGKVKLDGKITDYLPDYRKDTGDRVTIHQLLTHTSGIPSYTDQPGFFENVSRDPYTVDDFVKKYASGDLEFEPGSKFRYNNSGYFLLGAVIEKVTGKPYAQVLQENILTPAAMKNSGYDTAAQLISKRAGGYVKVGRRYVNAPYLDMSLPYAAGSLYSTVEDLYLWDQALYGDKILSAKSRELMFRPNLENYGYGIISRTLALGGGKIDVPVLTHSGGINGFNANIVRFVRDKNLIVLLDNTSRGDSQDRIIKGIANILYDQPYELPKRSVAEMMIATIDERGIDAAVKRYRELKSANSQQYDFGESELNTVGYQLMRAGKMKEAGQIFRLNVEMFPQASNTYDSLGEFYANTGRKDLAVTNYKRSLELDPKNVGAAAAIEKLESPAAAVDPKDLGTYVGKYEITPAFVLTITTADGRLYAQATGQQQFVLEPLAQDRFGISVVSAEIEFVKDAAGIVTGLVLRQGGRDIPAKRTP